MNQELIMDQRTVALVGALDTKHAEYGFLRDRLRAAGLGVALVDTGVLDRPGIDADLTREQVAEAAGGTLADLADAGDRNAAMTTMAEGAARLVADRVASGAVHGVLAVGGSNAAYVMGRVAAAVPIGLPKLLVSTMVAGDTRSFVGARDLTMMYPVVDIAGLNSITRGVLARAADALAGMVTGAPVPEDGPERPVVALTMMGVTTGAATVIQHDLEAAGAEVHAFHTTGVGGAGMEAMIAAGMFSAVLDLTPTELVDDLVGAMCTAGPDRLTAAGRLGIPQVVSTGGMDMANFGGIDSIPEAYRDRTLLPHNPMITLMRTDAAENAELGRRMAAKLNAATGPVVVHVPALGFSQISVAGAPFHDPAADRALIEALQAGLDDRIECHVHELDVNDPAFAAILGAALDELITTDPSHDPTRQEGISR